MTALRGAFLLVVVAVGLALAGPAGAQTYTGGNVPNVGRTDAGPVVVQPVRSGAPTPKPAHVFAPAGGRTAAAQGFAPVRVALTGADVMGLVGLGLAMVVVGAGAVRGSRRLPAA